MNGKGGITPERRLCWIFIYFSFTRSDNFSGMVPVKALLSKYSSRSKVKLASPSGMLPVMPMEPRPKLMRSDNDDNVLRILPRSN